MIDNCISGITANRDRCEQLVESSVGLATALCPYVGYKKAAEIAKQSLETGIPVRELVMQSGLLTEEQLKQGLDLVAMTQPGHQF